MRNLFISALLPSIVQPFMVPTGPLSTPMTSSKPQLTLSRRACGLMAASNPEDEDSSDNKDAKNNNNMPSDDDLFRDSLYDSLSMDDDTFSISDMYDEDDEDDVFASDPYAQAAVSEFSDDIDAEDSPTNNTVVATTLETALARQSRQLNTSPLDWAGALTTLRGRMDDIESGQSTKPSNAYFRTISRERPNEAIGRFVREANPEVVAAMTGTVSSLLGSLSNPAMGMEVIVQASSEKLGSLCLQLMMTGYLFRNAEYVVALKSLMDIGGEGATLEDYKAAFKRLDIDDSGYLERQEIEALLADVYDGKPPAYEVSTFLRFFDSNNDGRVSWEEFEKGFGMVNKVSKAGAAGMTEIMSGRSLPGVVEEDDEELSLGEPTISGTIEVELEDGKVIEVDAQDYVNDLKEQARELQRELDGGKSINTKKSEQSRAENPFATTAAPKSSGEIASYIASLQGDVQSLTKGISPDVVESMKLLIDFVLEPSMGSSKGKSDRKKEMELPGSALQTLALWQLVIGYRLRETEATGEWRKMLE